MLTLSDKDIKAYIKKASLLTVFPFTITNHDYGQASQWVSECIVLPTVFDVLNLLSRLPLHPSYGWSATYLAGGIKGTQLYIPSAGHEIRAYFTAFGNFLLLTLGETRKPTADRRQSAVSMFDCLTVSICMRFLRCSMFDVHLLKAFGRQLMRSSKKSPFGKAS